MRKHRRKVIAALVLFVIAGIGVLIIALGPREPVYEGKPLSFWLRQVRKPVPPVATMAATTTVSTVLPGRAIDLARTSQRPATAPAPAATTQPLPNAPPPAANRPPAVGTALAASTPVGLPRVDLKAVPYLLKSVKAKNGPLHNAYGSTWPKLPQWLQSLLPPPADAAVIRENAAILLADVCRADTATQRAAGRAGYHNVAIVTALLKARKDSDKAVREAAANALWLCDPEIAIKGSLE